MTLRSIVLLAALFIVACAPKETPETEAPPEKQEKAMTEKAPETPAADAGQAGPAFEIAPGLSARTLQSGEGATAAAGQTAVVHYTGWLYDDTQADNRGEKFDSSVDRGQPFGFPLGGGRVIQGWDKGVEGMLIGEKRELTIAPEMGYGDRGAGDVIPPGATLVFEVELLELNP
jgi:FKBP-type peptidyl-prolyl cis-trans isomerase